MTLKLFIAGVDFHDKLSVCCCPDTPELLASFFRSPTLSSPLQALKLETLIEAGPPG